jgi:hypothetical protein
MSGRQGIISNLPSSSVFLSDSTVAMPLWELSQPTINDALSIARTDHGFQDPALIPGPSPVRLPLDNPIGFDKSRAILKIPKSGIQ